MVCIVPLDWVCAICALSIPERNRYGALERDCARFNDAKLAAGS